MKTMAVTILRNKKHDGINELRNSHICHLWAKLIISIQLQSLDQYPGKTSGLEVKLTNLFSCHFPSFYQAVFFISAKWFSQFNLSDHVSSFTPLKVSCLWGWPNTYTGVGWLPWPYLYITVLYCWVPNIFLYTQYFRIAIQQGEGKNIGD